MAESKVCGGCKQELPLTDFYFRNDTGLYRAACKKCKSINSKEAIQARVNSPVKKCNHCGETKPVSEFQKAGGGKWTQPYCKPCDADRKRKHQRDNAETYKKKRSEYYQNNTEAIKESISKYRAANMGKVKERSAGYRISSADKIKERGKKYMKENATVLKAKRKEYYRKNVEVFKQKSKDRRESLTEEQKQQKKETDRSWRLANKDRIKANKSAYYALKGNEMSKKWQASKAGDIEFVTKKRLRGRIYVALRRGVKSETTMKLLGCTIEEFKAHFQSLFTDGMSWEHYIKGDIHIDHIIPCKNFNLVDPEEQRKCFHYTNLQPLWEIDNLKKGTKIIKTDVWQEQ